MVAAGIDMDHPGWPDHHRPGTGFVRKIARERVWRSAADGVHAAVRGHDRVPRRAAAVRQRIELGNWHATSPCLPFQKSLQNLQVDIKVRVFVIGQLDIDSGIIVVGNPIG